MQYVYTDMYHSEAVFFAFVHFARFRGFIDVDAVALPG